MGRPLPRDTSEVLLAEEFEHDTVEESLATAVRLWDERRFFEAHECLEDVWHHATGEDRAFWKGIIQVAITCCHHQRGNDVGWRAMQHKASVNLAGAPSRHRGVDVTRLRQFLADADSGTVTYPRFPALDGGPWFATPDASTPLTRQPPWQAAAAARAPGELA